MVDFSLPQQEEYLSPLLPIRLNIRLEPNLDVFSQPNFYLDLSSKSMPFLTSSRTIFPAANSGLLVASRLINSSRKAV